MFIESRLQALDVRRKNQEIFPRVYKPNMPRTVGRGRGKDAEKKNCGIHCGNAAD